MTLLRSKVRIQQSKGTLTNLRNEISHWFERRAFGPQYHTQLTTLQDVITLSLDRLDGELDKIIPSEDSGPVYRQCRVADHRLVWVRRVWTYFAAKFDQRSNDRYTALLKAADEVVWACYSEALRKVDGGDRPKKPIPLPYIEPEYAPRAFTRLSLPPEIRPDLATNEQLEGLQKQLAQLPVPLVGLPATCLEEPWWLALIAHEVGHNVAADLRPEGKALHDFQDWLYGTAKAADQAAGLPVDEAAAAEWFNWGDEVFADLFSVACLGPAAVWVMAELETTDETGLLTPLLNYPAPLVRLSLLAAYSEALGAAVPDALKELAPGELTKGEPLLDGGIDLRQTAAAHLRRAAAIAGQAQQLKLPSLPELAFLAGFDPGAFEPRKGRAADWAAHFLGETSLQAEKTTLDTRLATSGAVLAWRQATRMADEPRDQRLKDLSGGIPAALLLTHEESVRSAEAPAQTGVEDLARALGDWLLDPRQEVGLP